MKYKVTVYQEQYTDYIVDAFSKEHAKNLAIKGKYDEIDDITVRHSEVVDVENTEDYII